MVLGESGGWQELRASELVVETDRAEGSRVGFGIGNSSPQPYQNVRCHARTDIPINADARSKQSSSSANAGWSQAAWWMRRKGQVKDARRVTLLVLVLVSPQ